MNADGLNPFQQEVLVNVINFSLLLRENQHLQQHQCIMETTRNLTRCRGVVCTHRGRGLLQALKQVHHPGLLLDVLHLLNDVKAGGTRTAHIDRHGVDEGTSGEALDLLWHGCTKQQRLPLALMEQRWGGEGRGGEGRGGEERGGKGREGEGREGKGRGGEGRGGEGREGKGRGGEERGGEGREVTYKMNVQTWLTTLENVPGGTGSL